MQAAWLVNAFRNSLPTCAKSQKNNSEIAKLFRLACRCDVLLKKKEKKERSCY